MSLKCCAFGCLNKEGKTDKRCLTFHRFPSASENPSLFKKWKNATCNADFTASDDSSLCNEHFMDSDFTQKEGTKVIRSDAFPTKFKAPVKNKFKNLSSVQIKKLKKEPNPFLEIHNLSLNKQSDLNSEIRRISFFFGVKLEQSHIICSFIIKRKTKPDSESMTETIIVKFRDLEKKRELIEAFKTSESTLIDKGSSESIFMTEDLAPENRRLLPLTDGITSTKNKSTKSVKKAVINDSDLLKAKISPSDSQQSRKKDDVIKAEEEKPLNIEDVESLLKDLNDSNNEDDVILPEKVLTEDEIKVESDVHLTGDLSTSTINDELAQDDDVIFDEMMSTSSSNKELKVSLERLTSGTFQSHESPSDAEKKKPFKKRFSTDNSDETEESNPKKKGPGAKGGAHRGRKSLTLLHKAASRTSAPKEKEILTRRRIIKPTKYRDDYVYYSTTSKSKNKTERVVKSSSKKEEEGVEKKPRGRKPSKKLEPDDWSPSSISSQSSDGGSSFEVSPRKKSKQKIVKASEEKTIKAKSVERATKGSNNSVKNVMAASNVSSPVKSKATARKSTGGLLSTAKTNRIVSTPISSKVSKGNTVSKMNEENSSVTIFHGFTPVNGDEEVDTTSKAGGSPSASVSLPQTMQVPQQQASVPNTTPPNNSTNFKLITSFDHLMGHLRERLVLENHLEEVLSKEFSGQELYMILRCQDAFKRNFDYSELQMRFALSIYLNSFSCFNYLKEVFSLPYETAMEERLMSLNFEPGLLTEHLEFISNRIATGGKEDLRSCCLIADVVPITPDVICSTSLEQSKINKFCNFTVDDANYVLIVMLCSISKSLNIPIAYFPLVTVYPEFLARIIHICISKLSSRGARIWNVVLDASERSISAAKLLGCAFDYDTFLVSTVFSHIRCQNKISVIFDPYHLLKLTRDTMSQVGIISSKMGFIEWKYIKLLNREHCNKVLDNENQIENCLQCLKMDLSLAEALEDQKKIGNTRFTCCKPTAAFIRVLDKILSLFSYPLHNFDLDPFPDVGRKSYKTLLPEIPQYLKSLKISNVEFTNRHYRHNCIIGFISTLNSIGFIFDKIKTKYIVSKSDQLIHRFTLDPIDMFFHALAKPTISTPGRLTLQQGLQLYFKHLTDNIFPLTELPMLLVDFRSTKRGFGPRNVHDPTDAILFYMDMLTNPGVKEYSDSILTLISNKLTEKVCRQIVCLQCIDSLQLLKEDEDISDTNDLDHNYSSSDWKKEFDLIYSDRPIKASKDVFNIIKMCERTYLSIKSKIKFHKFSIESQILQISTKIKIELMESQICLPFSKCNHPICDDVTYVTHEAHLMTSIIDNYIRLRLSKINFFSSLLT